MTSIGDEDREPGRWHVNRGIPVVFLISSIVWGAANIGVFVWYGSRLDLRVETVERIQATATQAFEKVQSTAAVQSERLARLEEKVAGVQSGVSRIEALLTKPAR